MAFASALSTPKGLQCLPSSRNQLSLAARPGPANLVLPRHFPARFSSAVAFARRKNHRSAATSSQPKSKKKISAENEEDEVDGDAIDALFSLLEEDLKNDGVSFDDEDDDISEEDLARLEQELAEAFGIDEGEDEDEDEDEDEEEDEDGDDVIESDATEEEDEEDDDDDDVEVPVKLKTWQFRRLASALKVGRRKTSIKNLAAELCLDRALVLQMLRDPPPNLLMLSAALPDEPAPKQSVPEETTVETTVETVVETSVETVVETTTNAAEVETAVKVPIHVRQQKFAAQKRLKKVHLDTLERVYRRTKRPTNAIVSSIVHVTNLPRKRIVKWFEDKRSEEGVPDSRLPYQRSAPSTA